MHLHNDVTLTGAFVTNDIAHYEFLEILQNLTPNKARYAMKNLVIFLSKIKLCSVSNSSAFIGVDLRKSYFDVGHLSPSLQ
jgi:hypothetical protein